jgi:esterase/lipase superfamily enzyme
MRVSRLVAALLFAVAVHAQSTVTVVVSRVGNPIPGVTITLTGGAAPMTAVTDAKGIARFRVPPGNYRVIAERPGYSTAEKRITVGRADVEVPIDLFERSSEKRAMMKRPPAIPPPPPPPAPPAQSPSMQPPVIHTDIERAEGYAVVHVYYATDRAPTGETAPAKMYGARRGRLSLGIARVSIPREHRLGELEAPTILKLQFSPDPKRDVVLLSVEPQRAVDFYRKLQDSVRSARNRETFVFIHGYNVTFEDAARRVAQIKYDLAFDGPAILYSWPSYGETSKYPDDQRNADWAAHDLKTFLADLAARSGATSVHLVAHSMGNRVLAAAMHDLAAAPMQPHFDQVVLAAPDLDADVFKRALAPAFFKLANHLTLYASAKDEALVMGHKFDSAPRLGDTGSGIVVMPEMDTIDVTDVDTSFLGHSYVAENSTVLSDVYCLMRGAAHAAARCRLKSLGKYWRFVTGKEALTNLADYRCSAASCMIR